MRPLRPRVLAITGVLSGCLAIGIMFVQSDPDSDTLMDSTSIDARSLAAGPKGRLPLRSVTTLNQAKPTSAENTDRDPVPLAYGRNGRVFDFEGKTAAQFIAQRSAAARMGDMRAAYEVYQAESVCAANEDPAPEFWVAEERTQFLRERASLQKICNLSPVQIQERLQFLAQAARSGIADAQIDFFVEGPYGKPIDLTASVGDPMVQQWKSDAQHFLETAARTCDSFALSLLSNAYDAGGVVERTPTLAMAYRIAAAAVQKSTLTTSQLQHLYGDQMAAPDFEAALLLGETITRNSCRPLRS